MTEMAIAEANKGLLIDNDDDYLNHLLCLLQILMGKIYQDQNENEKAQEYYGKFNQRIDEILSDSKQTVFQELDLLTLQGNTYINLSNIDRLQNNLEKASINLKKSLDCYKRIINNSRKSDQTLELFKKCQETCLPKLPKI